MTQFGPDRSEPLVGKARSSQRRAPAGAGKSGQRSKAQQQQQPRGRGRRSDDGPAAPPAGGNALQQLAARVQQQGQGHARSTGNSSSRSRHQAQAEEEATDVALAAGARVPRRDMLSHLAELLGAPQLAAYQQAGFDLQDVVQHAKKQQKKQQALLPQLQQQQQWSEDEEPAAQRRSPAPEPTPPPPADFTKRNMARLGGEGVAGIFGGASAFEPAQRSRQPGPVSAASGSAPAPAGSGFMSALLDLKAGLSDDQRTRQAAQREQLKRDLEEQMRVKKEAEAQRKAALAAQEEREEAELRAYWAAQARTAQGEQHSAAAKAAAKAQAQQQAQALAREATQRGGGRRVQAQQQQEEEGTAGSRRGLARQAAPAPTSSSPPAGGARRGEALVQPGSTVFLPPDKEAERRGALRARLASQSYSEEAEAEQLPAAAKDRSSSRQAPPAPGAAAAAWQQALLQHAAAGGMLAAQQPAALPLLTPAQAAAWLAAGNPALAAASGLPPLYASLPMPAVMPAPATAAAPSTDPQVLSLLRDLAAEQQRMRGQFEAQMEALSRLSGDASAARSERDRARQDLERVQRLLAERHQGSSSMGGGGQQHLWAGGDGEEMLLSVTSHVLPVGVGIPSRLGTPAGRGVLPAGLQQREPARYRQQAAEACRAQPQRGNGGVGTKTSGRAGAPPGAGRPGQAVVPAGAQGSGRRGSGSDKAALPAGTRGTWRK